MTTKEEKMKEKSFEVEIQEAIGFSDRESYDENGSFQTLIDEEVLEENFIALHESHTRQAVEEALKDLKERLEIALVKIESRKEIKAIIKDLDQRTKQEGEGGGE